ncbi:MULTISPECIES: hypothetical protein [Enterobacteriaceae]|uniref:hypothetical protein n=1 Tax=Enterobacteriaceae TaxID=543 RepID=UPI001BAE813D|nr:hypothetical protein [Citrobacter sp. TBCS-15]
MTTEQEKRISEEEFETMYPRGKYDYIRTKRLEKGHLGQTEIDSYDIKDKTTGETVLKATFTDHTNVNGLQSFRYWEI